MQTSRHIVISALFLIIPFFTGCGDDTVTSDDGETYIVEVSGEEFRVRVTDATRSGIDDRFRSQERGVVIGTLVRGDGGFNRPWSWHLDPTTVQAVDAAIELCDGRPSMVEADLDYWIDKVGSFCPWGARVVRREP